MFRCEEYQFLDESFQAQILWLDGVFLMIRKTKNLNVELYALYNFYVEIFYDKKDGEPLYIKSFDYGTGLDVYLEGVVVDDIFEKMK